ncbi:MAG: sensor histidine kinase [Ekhidna sp.]
MSSSFRNIILILTFVILLPVSIFTAVEVGSLNEDEKILEEVYREQLDAIIFSINQYSSDLFNFYVGQIDYQWKLSENKSLIDSTFIQQNLAIEAIAAKDQEKIQLVNLKLLRNFTAVNADSIFQANSPLIERLTRYKESGYLKPESLGAINLEGQRLELSLLVIGKNTPCLIFINPVLFIEDLLAPKIQQISSKQLHVSVRCVPTNDLIYSQGFFETENSQTGALLLLEGYEISVNLQDRSVEGLIRFRSGRTIIALSMLILLTIVGGILVVRNLKKEIQLSKAKADFVANVSHEIRTPLSLISMFNETLLLGRVKEESKKKEYYEIIAKETSRLKNIVNKILSFSQIDADRKNYELITINANGVIEDVINSYSYHLEAKGFAFEMELEATNQIIKADQEAFTEVIINLIDNAVKYSKDNKFIKVSTIVESNQFIVEILDKGIGISSENKQRVFDKFFRAEGWETHNTKGTGLGLSLVNEIMKAHNGQVELDSKIDKGSTFRLIFPIAT